MLNNIFRKHKNIVLFFLLILALNVFFIAYPIRIDFTSDKRFSLSQATKVLISEGIQSPITIQILLTGEMPVQFKKLSKEVSRILKTMQYYDNKNLINIEYLNIKEDIPDSIKQSFYDTLYYLGIRPSTIKASIKRGEGTIKQTVLPAALVRNEKQLVGVSFLSENLYNNVISLNNAESLLEYKFAHAIEKISSASIPILLYAVGHGEPFNYTIFDLLQTLSKEYAIDTVNLRGEKPILKPGSLLLINNPKIPFTEEEKLKIDQFLMHGGNLMFCIEQTNANMAQLYDPKGQLVGINNTNLDDLLFHYGIRVKKNLVQDLECDKIAVQVGWNGDKPQYDLLPWYFYPLLKPNKANPITKGIDLVLGNFSSSIELIDNENIQEDILLATSNTSRTQNVPSKISLESLKIEPDAELFKSPSQAIAVMNKGKFSSQYKNILTQKEKNTIEKSWGFELKYKSRNNSKVLVVADGDMFLNTSYKDKPTEMGSNIYTKYVFGNKIFLQNSIEYLTSNSNILEARKKNFALRSLDKRKVENDKTYFQYFNLVIPTVCFSILILILNIWRYRKYHFVP